MFYPATLITITEQTAREMLSEETDTDEQWDELTCMGGCLGLCRSSNNPEWLFVFVDLCGTGAKMKLNLNLVT